MGHFGYFRLEHSSFNKDDWGYGRVAEAAHYGANQNKRGHVATVGIPLYGTSHETRQAFLEVERLNARKNARLGDSLIVSFPKEVSEPHRLLMMERFLSKVTFEGRTYAQAWEHTDKPDNPHFHVVLIDRDRITGKAVGKFGHSRSYRKKEGLEPNVTEWMRIQWEDTGNEIFGEHGYDLTFDRRSNFERGLEPAGEHRGYQNDNHIVEADQMVSEPLPVETEDALEGEDQVTEIASGLIGVDPVQSVKLLHTQVGRLEYLHRSQEKIKDAQERYEWLVAERLKVTAEAGNFELERLDIEQEEYRSIERLAEYQKPDGKLKGIAIGAFGFTLFRSKTRQQAETLQVKAHSAKLDANAARYKRNAYESQIGQLSEQATQEERKAYTYRAELENLYGNDAEVAAAEAAITTGIKDTVVTVTLGEAVTAYGEGLITEDEYRTFLTEGGYEAELQLLDEGQAHDGQSL